MTTASKTEHDTTVIAKAPPGPALREPLLLKLGHLPGAPAIVYLGMLTVGMVGLSMVFDMPVLTAVMTAYLVGIMRYVVLRQEREFDQLRHVIDCDDAEADRLRATFRRHPRSGLLITWILGPSLMIAINFAGPGITALRQDQAASAGLVWGVALAMLFWVFACQMILVVYNNSRTFGVVGRDLARIDLLSSGSLVPFARVGIRNALVYFGAYALLPLVYLEGTVYLPALFVSLAITIPIAVLTLLVPILPIHRRIKQEKAAELERIQKAMHGDRASLDELSIGIGSNQVGFTDLLLYRQMIEGVREWPITTPVVIRLAVYVVIPLLTWFGAAIVEHVVAELMS